jgi:hypothetical protein
MLFEIKDDINLNDLQEMQPALLILWTATVLYCKEHRLPCKITSISSDRKNVRAVSKTHEEGRALDISTRGWREQDVLRFVYLMNQDYREIAAVSASDGEPRAAVWHNYNEQGEHIHLQVKRNAPYNKYLKYDFFY